MIRMLFALAFALSPALVPLGIHSMEDGYAKSGLLAIKAFWRASQYRHYHFHPDRGSHLDHGPRCALIDKWVCDVKVLNRMRE